MFVDRKTLWPRRFPSEVVPGLLYLGDWSHAEELERLREINVTRYNAPEQVQ